MKKKFKYLISILIFLIIGFFIFLNYKSIRYTGVNFIIESQKISNFQKMNDFYKRHNNYQELTKKINNNDKNYVINVGKWVFKNINKVSSSDVIIDSHPWTIIERKIGTNDQFSDITSVLLFYSGLDAFYISRINKIFHPLTIFKFDNEWSLIDPYYGIYFLNNKSKFCNIEELKKNKCNLFHVNLGRIDQNNLKKNNFTEDFKNFKDVNNYYHFLFKDIPSSKKIEETNIYLRGGRSYIQKPIHRLFYQLQRSLNLIN